MNLNYEQIRDALAFSTAANGDILVLFRPSSGSLYGINVEDFQIGDDSLFEWNPLTDYSFSEAVTYNAEWYQSLVPGIDTNTGNIPADGLIWELLSKVAGIIIKKWVPGLVTEHLTLFREDTTIYGLKDTAILPYNSLLTPSADLANWEVVGGGGEQLNIDAGTSSRVFPTITQIDGGTSADLL